MPAQGRRKAVTHELRRLAEAVAETQPTAPAEPVAPAPAPSAADKAFFESLGGDP